MVEPVREVMPPQIPDWERTEDSTSGPDERWERAPAKTAPRPPAPAGPRRPSLSLPWRGSGPPSRAVVTAIVLVSLCLVFVAVAAVVASLHQSNSAPTAPAVASRSTVAAADVTRIRAATDAAGAATSATRSGLHSLFGIPTPASVGAVINPYVRSLQRYRTVLAETAVPESARPETVNAHVLVTRDVQFLGTINGLPPLRLGSYLEEFGSNTVQLQRAFDELRRALNATRT